MEYELGKNGYRQQGYRGYKRVPRTGDGDTGHYMDAPPVNTWRLRTDKTIYKLCIDIEELKIKVSTLEHITRIACQRDITLPHNGMVKEERPLHIIQNNTATDAI